MRKGKAASAYRSAPTNGGGRSAEHRGHWWSDVQKAFHSSCVLAAATLRMQSSTRAGCPSAVAASASSKHLKSRSAALVVAAAPTGLKIACCIDCASTRQDVCGPMQRPASAAPRASAIKWRGSRGGSQVPSSGTHTYSLRKPSVTQRAQSLGSGGCISRHTAATHTARRRTAARIAQGGGGIGGGQSQQLGELRRVYHCRVQRLTLQLARSAVRCRTPGRCQAAQPFACGCDNSALSTHTGAKLGVHQEGKCSAWLRTPQGRFH